MIDRWNSRAFLPYSTLDEGTDGSAFIIVILGVAGIDKKRVER